MGPCAAHTTENPYARVYSADAGEGDGGMHFFDLLYPARPFKRPKWKPPAGSRLDFEALSKSLAAAEKKQLDAAWQPKLPHPDLKNLRYEQRPAVRLPGQLGWLYETLDCAQRGKGYHCRPIVLVLGETVNGLAVQNKKELDELLDSKDRLFEYLPPAITDLDGDGQQELLLRYRMSSVDSEGYAAEWLSILNLPDLSNAFTPRRIGALNQATGKMECVFELYRLRLNRDKLYDLRVIDTEGCDAPGKEELAHDREHGDKSEVYTGIEDLLATPKRRLEFKRSSH